MNYKQKRGGYKTSFDFGEEELTYTVDNSRTKRGSNVLYNKIPERCSYREVRLWWLKYFTVFYLTFCAMTFLLYSNYYERLMITLYAATLFYLCVCLYAFMHRQSPITTFPLNPVLMILHDGRQQAIIEELLKRRRDMIKEKMAHLDTAKPYYEESSKFSWLREEGIISEQEYQVVRQKIAAMRDKASGVPGSPIH